MKRILIAVVMTVGLSVGAQGAMIWSEDFNDNNWDGTLNMECGNGQAPPQCCPGTISFSSVTSPKRAGSRAGRTVLKRCHERAEWREKSRNHPAVGADRYYGFSLRPASNYDTNRWTLVMQGVQWYSSIPNWAQGAWHRLIIENGRWKYVYKYSNNGGTGSSNVRETTIDLGSVQKNKWTDFIIHGKWTRNNRGLIKIWVRQPGGNYTVKHNRSGWVMLNIPKAPYFKIGQYRGDPNWSGANSQDTLYVDEIKVGTTWQDVDI